MNPTISIDEPEEFFDAEELLEDEGINKADSVQKSVAGTSLTPGDSKLRKTKTQTIRHAHDQCLTAQVDLRKDHLLFAQCLAVTEIKSIIKTRLDKRNDIIELPEGHEFLCPISHEVMNNPVTTKEGSFTFDLENIKQWLELSRTNPLTRKPLTTEQLILNRKLKKKIDHWKQGEIDEDDFVAQGADKKTWDQYQIICRQLLEREPTISFKRMTKAVSTDLLVKYHREIFSSTQTRVEILSFYEKNGMIKPKSELFPDESFCKSEMGSFIETFLFNTELDLDTRLKVLTVKNMLLYYHPIFQDDLREVLKNNVKVKKDRDLDRLAEFHLSETIDMVWWAQDGNVLQAFCDKYKLIYTGKFLKTVSWNALRWSSSAIHDALSMLIFCPERAKTFSGYVDNPSLKNASKMLKSGLGLAAIVMLLERSAATGIFNCHAHLEYKAFIENPSCERWYNLVKANPGVVAFVATTLGVSAYHIMAFALKGAVVNFGATEQYAAFIKNPSCESFGNLLKANPGALAVVATTLGVSTYHVMAFVLKGVVVNFGATEQYAAFIKNPSCESFGNLLKANPGALAVVATTLGVSTYHVMAFVLKGVVVNFGAIEQYKAFLENPSCETFGSLLKANPGVLAVVATMFGVTSYHVLAFTLKGAVVNFGAAEQYAAFIKNPSCETFGSLLKANPGVLAVVATMLGVTSYHVLAFTLKGAVVNFGAAEQYAAFIKNPSCESFGNLLKANPGALAVVATTLGVSTYHVMAFVLKGVVVNFGAIEQYKAFLENPSCETFGSLLKANPGALAVVVTTLGVTSYHVLAFTLKSTVFNPSATEQYAAFVNNPSCGTYGNLLKANPGVVTAIATGLGVTSYHVLAFTLKSTVFNPSATEQYAAFVKNPSCETFSNLLKANPGALAVVATTLGVSTYHVMAFVLKGAVVNFGAAEQYKAFLENPSCETFGNLLKANPGAIAAIVTGLGVTSYHVLAFTLKSTVFNPSAIEQYEAFVSNPSRETWGNLVEADPGIVGGVAVTLGVTAYHGLTFTARKTFIDPKDMVIPFFKFLKGNENYFSILHDCDIPTNELYTDDYQLKNLNEIDEKNYLKIKINNDRPSEELIKNLRDKLKIIIPKRYSTVFNRFNAEPNCKHAKAMFRKGGAMAAAATCVNKAVSSSANCTRRFFQPHESERKNEPEAGVSPTLATG